MSSLKDHPATPASEAKEANNPPPTLTDKIGGSVSSSPYSTIRHTYDWVAYQGVNTTVSLTVLGENPLPSDRHISLQRRGWRTGLLGWSIGSYLGGGGTQTPFLPTAQSGPSTYIDVTPVDVKPWDTDSIKNSQKIESEIQRYLSSSLCPSSHRPLETDVIHIPVSSGDGYFRLVIFPSEQDPKVIAASQSFRIGSLSLSSAHPRGASLATLPFELLLKAASVTVNTAVWAGFYATFPVLKLVDSMPATKSWGGWALNKLYQAAGGESIEKQLMEKYSIQEKKEKARDVVYRNVPFGSMGVRTLHDLEEDEKVGKDGVCYKHE